MIGDYLSYLPNLAVIFKHLSYKLDAVFGSCSLKFSARKNESGAIVENHADLFSIESTGVPIKMNCGEAMFSFISNPGLPAFLFFVFPHWPNHSQGGPDGLHYAVCVCRTSAR